MHLPTNMTKLVRQSDNCNGTQSQNLIGWWLLIWGKNRISFYIHLAYQDLAVD